MSKYEIRYNGKELPGLVESLTKDINYFLKEVEILEDIEWSLSNFISESIAELSPETQRGRVWLSRFNAKKTQKAFYVQFTPTAKEREKVRFIQTGIAEGRFLNKEICFWKDSCWQLPYIAKEVIPSLKTIFTKFGFKILKEDESFS